VKPDQPYSLAPGRFAQDVDHGTLGKAVRTDDLSRRGFLVPHAEGSPPHFRTSRFLHRRPSRQYDKNGHRDPTVLAQVTHGFISTQKGSCEALNVANVVNIALQGALIDLNKGNNMVGNG
jgi:hypothetical protein